MHSTALDLPTLISIVTSVRLLQCLAGGLFLSSYLTHFVRVCCVSQPVIFIGSHHIFFTLELSGTFSVFSIAR